MSHGVRRKLTTIFCADVVGYSRLMGADETGTLRRLKECRELVAAFIDRHRGRVVSWSGDAVLADFASVVEAVQCAIELQMELKARNDGKPEAERMEFRIGINLGDVMIEDHDIFGEGVNIASRLQSLAAPGGILVSGSVHDQVRNKLAVGFNFMGHQQVKNIADQVPVFHVAHDGAPILTIAAGQPAAALSYNKTTAAKPAATRIYATLLSRAGAGLVDVAVSSALALAIGIALVTTFGDVIELDDPLIPLAIERTIDSDAPSLEIIAGGTVTRTTQRFIVERNFLGLATQTVRRTRRELSIGQGANIARPQDTAELSGIKGDASESDALIDRTTRQPLERPTLTFIMIASYFSLLSLCEGLLFGGRSPGKLVFGLRVAGAHGEAMTFWRALARNLAKILSVATAFVGFLLVLWTRRHQALHDMIADSVVLSRESHA